MIVVKYSLPSIGGTRSRLLTRANQKESVMARSFFLLVLLALSANATAQEDGFKYSFISASYNNADYDQFNSDGDGFGVGVSLAFADNFHVFGNYVGADLGSSFDANGWEAGVGFNTPISNLMDIVVQLSLVTAEVDTPFGTVDDDGYSVAAGLRAGANEWIELDVGIAYVDTDSGAETALEAGFLFNVSSSFAVGVSGSWDDDVTIWNLDGRLYFE